MGLNYLSNDKKARMKYPFIKPTGQGKEKIMGIFINLSISKSVTQKEWEGVYEETLRLVKNFPLAESRMTRIHGIDVYCLVLTRERQETYEWNDKKTRTGWHTNGDYTYMATAEDYYLPRELVNEKLFDENAGDAILGAFPAYLPYNWKDDRFSHVYEKWGNKTQGEPYHMYLLAVAALIEARLGSKAFTYGDITRGQFKKAVDIANQYLENPIEMPDRCYMDRLLKRVKQLPFTEREQLAAFESFYLGTQDAEFGACIRQNFGEAAIDAYWKDKFANVQIGTIRFGNLFGEYLLWGFELKKLCEYVCFQDENGNAKYEEFVRRVMDAKLHLKDKNCTDPLKIDQESERPYGVGTLFAQFVYAGAKNKKIDCYIPLADIRTALTDALGDKCDVNGLIDAYIAEENEQININLEQMDATSEEFEKAVEQDASEVFYQIMEKKREGLQEQAEKYDITKYETLKFYEPGASMPPGLLKTLAHVRRFMDSTLENEKNSEIMGKDASRKCAWLVEQNRHILIRDMDWDKVFTAIEQHPETFCRYYSIFRLDIRQMELANICTAFMINDDLYAYSKELVARFAEELG